MRDADVSEPEAFPPARRHARHRIIGVVPVALIAVHLPRQTKPVSV
ncbi:hypothetical protein [Burkholderia sp. LS-044]|nr:hypothetical protein [Burkholderia sp. LS-044]